MTQTIKDGIKAFIIENFLFGDTSYDLQDEASRIENEVIDSTGVLELVEFLESRFGIEVTEMETVPENLDSISNLTKFVLGKKAGSVH